MRCAPLCKSQVSISIMAACCSKHSSMLPAIVRWLEKVCCSARRKSGERVEAAAECSCMMQMVLLTATQHGWPLQALPEQQLCQAMLQDGYSERCVLLITHASRGVKAC